jgi:hypothetical protein
MNVAKTPIMREAATSITSIHMFSWIAGQWYLCILAERRSKTREPEVVVDAMAGYMLVVVRVSWV